MLLESTPTYLQLTHFPLLTKGNDRFKSKDGWKPDSCLAMQLRVQPKPHWRDDEVGRVCGWQTFWYVTWEERHRDVRRRSEDQAAWLDCLQMWVGPENPCFVGMLVWGPCGAAEDTWRLPPRAHFLLGPSAMSQPGFQTDTAHTF